MQIINIKGEKTGTRVGWKGIKKQTKKAYFHDFNFITVCNKRSLCTAAPHVKKIFEVRGGCTQATTNADVCRLQLRLAGTRGKHCRKTPHQDRINLKTGIFSYNTCTKHNISKSKPIQTFFGLIIRHVLRRFLLIVRSLRVRIVTELTKAPNFAQR